LVSWEFKGTPNYQWYFYFRDKQMIKFIIPTQKAWGRKVALGDIPLDSHARITKIFSEKNMKKHPVDVGDKVSF